MLEQKQATRRITVTLPASNLAFYAQRVREEGMKGRRLTTSDLIREAIREHIERLKSRG